MLFGFIRQEGKSKLNQGSGGEDGVVGMEELIKEETKTKIKTKSPALDKGRRYAQLYLYIYSFRRVTLL